jgi:hypothetical protein
MNCAQAASSVKMTRKKGFQKRKCILMLVVKSKPAREKQPVRAALHLITRQHEKAFREGRVSLTVISSSTLLKPAHHLQQQQLHSNKHKQDHKGVRPSTAA